MQVKDSELERYIDMYRKSVLGTALCYVRNTSDAEDILQEAFIKLYTYKGRFDSAEHVKAWLLRCTINLCKSLLRSYWYKFSEPLEAAETRVHCDEHNDGTVTEALRKINGKNRIVLYMYYYEGYSADEIAKITHSTVNSVMLRLSRGRRQLKELLIDERNDPDE